MEWYDAVEQLKPRVVRIRTPGGSGSGFMLPWESKTGLVAFATAAHVIDQAHYWEQPLRMDQVASGKTVLLRPSDRAIFMDADRDTAVIVCAQTDFDQPACEMIFVEKERHLRVGNEVGWLGFPAITNELCFFSGRISAWKENEKSYFVDAVAVNGVSGGLVFYTHDTFTTVVAVGVVSAYIVNRTTGESLPGLAVARDVSYLHDQALQFKSVDEARAGQTPPEPPGDLPEGEADKTSRLTL